MKGNFTCLHCGQKVFQDQQLGSKQRNHCPDCLWSMHVDLNTAGDRKSVCQGPMKPIGLTFKIGRKDKWGQIVQNELMLIHQCTSCGKISLNRISGDDSDKMIMHVFEQSRAIGKKLDDVLKEQNINLLKEKDKEALVTVLFGKTSPKL